MGDPWALHRLRGQPVPESGCDPILARDLVASALLDLYPGLGKQQTQRAPLAQNSESRRRVRSLWKDVAAAKAAGKRVNISDIAKARRENAT